MVPIAAATGGSITSVATLEDAVRTPHKGSVLNVLRYIVPVPKTLVDMVSDVPV